MTRNVASFLKHTASYLELMSINWLTCLLTIFFASLHTTIYHSYKYRSIASFRIWTPYSSWSHSFTTSGCLILGTEVIYQLIIITNEQPTVDWTIYLYCRQTFHKMKGKKKSMTHLTMMAQWRNWYLHIYVII